MKEKIYIPVKVVDGKVEIEGEKIKEAKNKRILLEIRDKDFTSVKIETQQNLLKELNEIIKKYKIYGIKIHSIPDSIDKKNLKMLKKYKVKEIELLIESSNDYILKNIKSDYKFKYAKKIANQIKFMRFCLGIKLVIGLPESTIADDLNTVKQCIELKPYQIVIIPCQIEYKNVIKNLFEQDEFSPLSQIQMMERIKESIALINKSKVKDLQIGEDNQNIYGINIDQFRDLIATDIWYDRIVEKIKSYNVKVKIVNVEVNPNDINIIKGSNNSNLEKLQDVYDVELRVIENNKIKKGDFRMEILKTYTDFLDDED